MLQERSSIRGGLTELPVKNLACYSRPTMPLLPAQWLHDSPLELTIISRDSCHLCDVVHRMAQRLQAEYPIELNKIIADTDPTLLAHYGKKVPVVLIDGMECCSGKITEGDLRRAMKRARWRRPISRILSRLGYVPRRG